MLALLLQACVTNRPPAIQAAPQGSYFWLPLLGIADRDTAQIREQFDAALIQRGYAPGGGGLALAIATDAPRSGDGSLGLGPYAGGYAYFTPRRAPHGMVVLEAYDAATLRRAWSVAVPRTLLLRGAALHAALDAAPGARRIPDVSVGRTRESPDAPQARARAASHANRDAL
jgi:hypothetical protein